MAVVDVDTPVLPFGATVAGTTALVPETRLFNGDGAPPDGSYAITAAQVAAWVAELTGVVAMTLDGWQRLNPDPVDPETTSDRAQLIQYARTVIHNGAGSYLEAARHPERSSVNTDSYSAVLWQRYTDGLDRLAGWLTVRLARLDPDDTPVAYAGGPASSFPDPLFGDGLRF